MSLEDSYKITATATVTSTPKSIIQACITHWERMIEWVKTQPPLEEPNVDIMIGQIKEGWLAEYCSFCDNYHTVSCKECPLCKKHGKCGVREDSNNNWNNVTHSRTWKQWLKEAKILLEQIRSLLND